LEVLEGVGVFVFVRLVEVEVPFLEGVEVEALSEVVVRMAAALEREEPFGFAFVVAVRGGGGRT
jgi:hypothetical protein